LVAERKEKSRHRLRYSSTSSDSAIRCSDDYVKIVYPQSRYSVKSETESHGTTCPNSKHQQCDSTIDQLLSHMAALTDELQQRLNMLTEETNALRKDLKSI
jgi:hypothetical protein